MRSYEAARSLFSFLGICSWAVIILGAILAFSGGTIAGTGFGRGASGMSALLGAAPGFILAMMGFYGLALVQMGRAGVDSAEYSQQSLEVSRQQLEVSREVLAQGKTAAASYAELLNRQPVAAKYTSDVSNATAPNPSYASGAAQTEPPAQLYKDSGKPKIAKRKPNEPEQIENTPFENFDDTLSTGDPVIFERGMWHVGERTFQSETPARHYAAQLNAKPATKLTDT